MSARYSYPAIRSLGDELAEAFMSPAEKRLRRAVESALLTIDDFEGRLDMGEQLAEVERILRAALEAHA